MGRSNQSKRRAKKAAKRRGRAARRAAARPVVGGIRADDPARAPFIELERDLLEAVERVREPLFSALRDDPCTFSSRPVAGMRSGLDALLQRVTAGPAVAAAYFYWGTHCWSERWRRTREDVLRATLTDLLRATFPAPHGPEGWLGCWSLTRASASGEVSCTDWLAPARPRAVGEPTPAQRGARAARRESLPVLPPVMFPHEVSGREFRDFHFIGWRVRRGDAVVFIALKLLTPLQVATLARAFLDAAELGRLPTATDWEGLLLTMALGLELGMGDTRPGRWWMLDDHALDATLRGWERVGVCAPRPVPALDFLRASGAFDFPFELDDPELGERVDTLLEFMDGDPAYMDPPSDWGPLYPLRSELLLLPLRLARAGGDTPDERLEAMEAVLDGVRRALRLTLFPYLRAGREALRRAIPREIFETYWPVAPDGPLARFDEEALRARPLAWLGLGGDHPAAAELGLGATAGAALRWAERRGAAPGAPDPEAEARQSAAEALRQAFATARVEARLAVLVEQLLWAHDADAPSRQEAVAGALQRSYTTLHLGLRRVFDPRAGATALSSLPLPGHAARRIVSALTRALDTGGRPPRVTDLPATLDELLELPGVGPKSAVRLVYALAEHARSWRRRFLSGAQARAAAPAPSARRAAKESLSEGLDALADLFGGDASDRTERGG